MITLACVWGFGYNTESMYISFFKGYMFFLKSTIIYIW